MNRSPTSVDAGNYCDGEFCAQVVWHAICWVVQLSWQVVLTLALPVVVAARGRIIAAELRRANA